jgi:hypothetical protein
MKNLEKENIRYDDGKIGIEEVRKFEKELKISLPDLYVNFIIEHDGARIFTTDFDYPDPNRGGRKNGDSIAFNRFEKVLHT